MARRTVRTAKSPVNDTTPTNANTTSHCRPESFLIRCAFDPAYRLASKFAYRPVDEEEAVHKNPIRQSA
jgi:hypothetical protein